MMKCCGGDVALTHADGTVQDDSGAVDAQRLHGLHHELPLERAFGATDVLPLCLLQRCAFLAHGQDLANDLSKLVERILQ